MNVGSIIASAPWLMQRSEQEIRQTPSARDPGPVETERQQAPARSAEPGGFRAQLTTPALASLASAQLREQKIEALIEPLKQANAVFTRLPRPSPLQDAQQAFEKRFPGEPRPVDLNRLHLRVCQLGEPPQVVASPCVAELIAAHYGGHDIHDLHARYPLVTGPLYYEPGNTCQRAADADSDHDSPWVPGFISTQDVLQFISQLPTNQPRNLAARQTRDFLSRGEDGWQARQRLGNIRKDQIALEARLQDNDRILGKAGQALVGAVVSHPCATELARAYPNEQARPKLYSLAVLVDDGPNRHPPLTLQGPFVMVQPNGEDGAELLVLYLPKLGLKQFNSREALRASIAASPALGHYLPEGIQARLPETTRPVLDTLEPIPPDISVFEHSIQQQIDKQERDTRYRLEQAGKRGVDLTEFDWIAHHSARDFRRSFEPPRLLTHPPTLRPLAAGTALAIPLRA
ncbi:hypothetical protein [Pseudomonas vanderleydeniana]|uniref:Uncharacterized protein n=1 Tax=Pseudomonas vanderleydeniana TaxID=2745495 RepID=A0A9E6PHH9_9PSED|nr:hypothetical protein [Pseudomonas vanderleydeniana]QXI26544.1 hypothetical protein HU752_021765 [Pseudomonas vanderleydeniana]